MHSHKISKQLQDLFFILLTFVTNIQTVSSAEPYTGPLTDEQFNLRDNFVHEGHTNREKDKLCGVTTDPETGKITTDEKLTELCSGKVSLFGKGGDSMIDAVAKMYGMFFSFTGLNYHDKAGMQQEQFDICAVIPMGTELVANTQQTLEQNKAMSTPVNPENHQQEALSRAIQSHATREKTALMQSVGWGATCTCYIYFAAKHGLISGKFTGGVELANHLGKPAAACALMGIYIARKLKAAEAKAETEEILRKFLATTGKGKCNPITEKSCYCAQQETRYDAKYCLPDILSKRPQKADTITSCVNNELKSDPECQCLDRKNCYDVTFDKMTSDFGLGNTVVGQSLAPIKSMMKGSFDQAAADSLSRNQLNAAKNFLKNLPQVDPGDINLGDKQKKETLALNALGLPLGLAAHISSQPLTEKGKSFQSDMKKFNSDMNIPSISNIDMPANGERRGGSNSRVLYFQDSRGSRDSANYNDSGSNMDFMDKFKKKPLNNQNDKILNFADKATREAQIYRNPSRSIFEILSNRYRLSTWEKFQVLR